MNKANPSMEPAMMETDQGFLDIISKTYPLCKLCIPRFFKGDLIKNHDVSMTSICAACLGNDDHWRSFVPLQIVEAFKKSGYDYHLSHFHLNITLPICHNIRQRILWVWMRHDIVQKRPMYLSLLRDHYSEVLDIKAPLRMALSRSFETISGLLEKKEGKFNIDIVFSDPVSESFIEWLLSPKLRSYYPAKYEKKTNIKRVVHESRAVIDEILSCISDNVIIDTAFNFYNNDKNSTRCVVQAISFKHDSIYIAGRYIKNSRQISQSPWSIKSANIESSVSGYIEDVLKENYRSHETRFSSAGREDMDVRMLGTGRPFLIEVINPKSTFNNVKELFQSWSNWIVDKSKGQVIVKDLTQVDGKIASKALKEGEETKSKIYRGVVFSSCEIGENELNSLSGLQNLKLLQKTPIRVLQRRANLSREKTIYRLSVQKINSHLFVLYIHAQAGTYIKEFVHGDFGRTLPSLGDVLMNKNDALELVELDVLHVDLPDWPPFDSIL